MHIRYTTILILAVSLIILVPAVHAAVEINYQAKVTDDYGQVITDGDYHMQFKIWNTGQASEILWQEVHTGENRVKVEGGVFKVKLGQINPLNFDFKEDSYYLSLVIGGKEQEPDWNSGISLLKKIKLADLTFKIETLEMDVLEKIKETPEILTKAGEPMEIIDLIQGAEGAWIFQGNVLTDSLIQSLSSPENTLDFFDSQGDIILTTAPDKDFKIVLGSPLSSVNILVGSLKIGKGKPEDLLGFELKGESAFISGDLGVVGKTYLGDQVFLSGQDIASQMSILEPVVEVGDVVVAVTDSDLTIQARLSHQPNDKNILGVVSEKSAAVLRSSPDGRRVALTGIVKIKVTTENGNIKKGDLLTTSSLLGRAMKASWPGAGVVAKALEDFDGERGVINALLQLGSYYTTPSQILVVAKTGGNFTSVAEALRSTKDASEESPYLIKIEPGVYQEKIIMKEYVDIVGAGVNLVKIIGEELPLVKGASRAKLEGVGLEVVGTPSLETPFAYAMIEAGSSDGRSSIFSEFNTLKLIGHQAEWLVGFEIAEGAEARMSNVEIEKVAKGIVKNGLGKVEVTHSNIKTSQSDLQALPEDAKIVSSYNLLAGIGYNFDIATGTAISSYADKYNKIRKQGKFEVLDYVRESEEPALMVRQKGSGEIIRLSNIDRDLFAVDAQGAVIITPQNSSGESFKILSQSENVGLQISQIGPGAAARFSGKVIVGPKEGEAEAYLTFEGPGVISAGGYPISIGGPGDTVKLDIPEVKYEWPTKLRRDTIFLYLAEPREGQHLLGDKNTSWQPEEEITILKLKLQYNVVELENNLLQMVLFDSMGNIIFDSGIISQDSPGYYQVVNDTPDKIANSISPDEGLYLVVAKAKGIEQLSMEIEYVFN